MIEKIYDLEGGANRKEANERKRAQRLYRVEICECRSGGI